VLDTTTTSRTLLLSAGAVRQQLGISHMSFKEVMPMLVKKGKNVYQYKSIREDGGRKTLYQGKLSMKQIQEHQTRKEEQALRKQHQQEMASLRGALDEVRAVNDLLIRAGLLVNNNYLRRSEIRRIKNG